MSLKLGAWKINENGVEDTLSIESVDPNTGVVGGNFPNFAQPLKGLWDETSQTITFTAYTQVADPMPRFYKGFLFSTPRNPAPGQDVVWTLVGFVQFFDLGHAEAMGGNARRSEFGWFAQITEVG